jgi:hypothetical protein
MDLLTAVLACSLHPDDQLVRAIVQVQSEGQQLFVGDLTELKGTDSARTIAEAGTLLAGVERKGHRAALGLMGVSPAWAVQFDHQPSELWGACINISVGTAKLSEFDYECRHPKRRPGGPASRPAPLTSGRNRICILRRYARQLLLPPTFLRSVMTAIASPPPPTPPAQPEGPSADWSPDLFFGEPTPVPSAPLSPTARTK